MVFDNGVKFDLDVSGIAGFFGGDESIAAMASVNLVRYRWLLGWYNSPGSYFVSRKYGIIASTRFWDGLFPGRDSVPAIILGMDGKHGPSFYGAKSGTAFLMTGHLAHLLFFHCNDSACFGSPEIFPPSDGDEKDDPSSPTAKPDKNEYLCSLTLVSMPNDDGKPTLTHDNPMEEHIKPMSIWGFIAAFLTIGFSIAAAVITAVIWQDFFGCIAISIGILCNGFATLVYGSGTLTIERPAIISNPIPGDGVFMQGNNIVILQGPESKVACFTRGKYKLTYKDEPSHHTIGFVSFSLVIQAFSQLILLPAATLKGQIIFLATFALSWFYNAYLASVDRENLQFQALQNLVGLKSRNRSSKNKAFKFKRWASTVAASAFRLRPVRPESWLKQLISNDTPVWDEWRKYIIEAIKVDSEHGTPTFIVPADVKARLDTEDTERLQANLDCAKIGYEWYRSQKAEDDLDCKYKY